MKRENVYSNLKAYPDRNTHSGTLSVMNWPPQSSVSYKLCQTVAQYFIFIYAHLKLKQVKGGKECEVVSNFSAMSSMKFDLWLIIVTRDTTTTR